MSESFGPFVLERLLGRGGMAEAFMARRAAGDPRWLVLKRIRPDIAHDQEYLRRLVLEAQVVSRAVHPSLVRFREFGRVGNCHYIVMDMVRGWSLHRLLERVMATKTPPPLPVALSLGAGLLDGLASLHGLTDEEGRPRPMIHRDVTPSNVIISREGRPVIIDFGIAKDVLGPAITLPGRVIGTARYMAPEHRRAEFIDPRADVFSASVILFELLAGRPPWPPLTSLKELLRVTFDPPVVEGPLLERAPREAWAIILRGLACNPEDRWPDAAAMLEALRVLPQFPRRADEAAEKVAAWASELGLSLDEALADPVLDLMPSVGGDAVVTWTPSGTLNSGRTPAQDSAPSTSGTSDVLKVPPLPPRRDESIGPVSEYELLREANQVESRRWIWGAAVLAVLAALWGLWSLGLG